VKYLYCRICGHRKIDCLGSDPKGCLVPMASIVYFGGSFVLPIAGLIVSIILKDRDFIIITGLITFNSLYQHNRK
jgi:hypothetical protein